MTRLDLLEEEVSNLNQKFLQLESRNMDPANSGNIELFTPYLRVS